MTFFSKSFFFSHCLLFDLHFWSFAPSPALQPLSLKRLPCVHTDFFFSLKAPPPPEDPLELFVEEVECCRKGESSNLARSAKSFLGLRRGLSLFFYGEPCWTRGAASCPPPLIINKTNVEDRERTRGGIGYSRCLRLKWKTGHRAPSVFEKIPFGGGWNDFMLPG